MIVIRSRQVLIAIAVLALMRASPTSAQDTTQVRKTEKGILVDFQDADIRAVITGLAEAAGLNVSYSDLPVRRTTIHLRQPVARADVPALLKSIALSNGLLYSDEGGLIHISAMTGAAAGARNTDADTSLRDVRLYVYRLKHARSASIAATLQAIFGGSRAGATNTGLSQRPLSERLRGQLVTPVAFDSVGRGSAVVGNAAVVLGAQLRGPVQIVPDETANALVVRALPADYETLKQAIEVLDLRPLQALIEVVIAEVRITDNLDLGMSGSIGGKNTDPNNAGNATLTSSAATEFVLSLTQANKNLTANIALAALSARGNVRILSRPLVLAQNNTEAKILVGEQRPFVQVSRSLPTDAGVRDQVIQYRDVATTLTILPTINPDGYVSMQVLQEVSSVTSEVQFGAPVISTREVSTHLFVKDAQTAVLGGLVGREVSHTKRGIPFLSSIPYLGALFGTQIDHVTTTELYLFITPHVIATDEDTDKYRDGLKRLGTDSTGMSKPERPIIIKPPTR